ncbi:putative membrane protein [Halobacteriovorax marinus SJ]|uniref:Membrane protein n=1 Tax=Halobacteriovorax marinus (strain ATCC BAA-682 / DSM 15412 / SJ) TaxID=862908 RepID=E1X0S7_HALMS|nr:hypothetical protein [Halobacteriovorax marinus]CBW26415.1 putative membrane protein [Halobacteriovorax marinus SJ]
MFTKSVGIIFVIISLYSCAHKISYKRIEKEENLSSLVFTGYGRYSYTRGNIETYLEELKLLNLNTASFLYSCQTKTLYSSNVDCSSNYTPSLNSIKMAIEMAKQRGFRVSLRHYIDVENKKWRCYWDPEDKELAFENIQNQLSVFAELLEEYKVENFIIGAEYCQLSNSSYELYWREIISKVREKFKGRVSYGANWEAVNNVNEFFETPIWKYVDELGLDMYFPIPNTIKKKEIYTYQERMLKKYIQHAKKFKKPLIINEIGYPGSKKGTLEPYEWRNMTPGPELRQAMAYRYTLLALKSDKTVRGIYLWRKLAANKYEMNTYNPNETDYNLWKRKAWYEVQSFFNNY